MTKHSKVEAYITCTVSPEVKHKSTVAVVFDNVVAI
jgi:hypothetical protein